MAEEIFDFLEATNSNNSFDDFEEMWSRMGESLEKQFISTRPVTPTPESGANLDSEARSATEGDDKLHNKDRSTTLTSSSDAKPVVPYPRYSPALDSNWPPVLDSPPSYNITEGGFEHVEDSIVTNLRRTNPEKLQKLEKRMREPEQDFRPQLELLRTLMSRVTADVQQIDIIRNYLEDKLVKETDSVKRLEQDFKPQLELLRTRMSRVTADVQQINISTNYFEDKLVKERDSIKRLQENVYKVRSVDDCGDTKVLHRKEILDTKESFQDNDNFSQESGSDSEDDTIVVRESKYVKDEPLILQTCEDEPNRYVIRESENESVADKSSEENISGKTNRAISPEINNENVLRRSKRSAAGKHSNPFKLPRSVLSNGTFANTDNQNADFQEFGNAMTALGASLSASLSLSFSEYLHIKNRNSDCT